MNKSYLTVLGFGISFLVSCNQMPIKTVPHDEAASGQSAKNPEPTSAVAQVNPNAPAKNDAKPLAIHLTQAELEKYAYEIGLDPRKELSEEQKAQVEKRKKLRYLERSLDSQKERLQYSKVLPWLKSDDEKLDYLSIPSIEGRQSWINQNKIWSRVKDLKGFAEVMESQDIAIGMPSDYVKKAWGDPDNIEASGNPIYKNERWKYLKQVSTPQGYRQERRLVYFEGGRVVGWETE
jgi:hypothetical protein